MIRTKALGPWDSASLTRVIVRALIPVTSVGCMLLLLAWCKPSLVMAWAPLVAGFAIIQDTLAPGKMGMLIGVSSLGIWGWAGSMSGLLAPWQAGVVGLVLASWMWVSSLSGSGPLYAHLERRTLLFVLVRGLVWLTGSAAAIAGCLLLATYAGDISLIGPASVAVAVLGCGFFGLLLWRHRHTS